MAELDLQTEIGNIQQILAAISREVNDTNREIQKLQSKQQERMLSIVKYKAQKELLERLAGDGTKETGPGEN